MGIYFIECLLAASFAFFSLLSACENVVETVIAYPLPINNVDEEIDAFLNRAEECLFLSDFREALYNVERAESLLPLTYDEEDYRKLRLMFDKAMIVTCIEGPTDQSYTHFVNFNKLLTSKSCESATNYQRNLFDQNGY